jgi:hypothetical protein
VTLTPLSEHDIKRIERIERFFCTIRQPGELIEIRAWHDDSTGIKGITSGLFNNLRKAAIAAIRLGNEGQHVYYTLNPISPDSLYAKKRELNKCIRKAIHTCKDNHIASRQLYLFDCDPKRPSGVCSTDAEKGHAWDQAQRLKQYLSELGWPEPIVADSGNGTHLYYLADGCSVSKEATENLQAALQYLKTMFPDLDASVFNASRICRVLHTMNRKGIDIIERPHRRAKIISYPEKFEPVMAGKIYQLAIKGGILTDDDGNRVKVSRTKGESNLLIDEAGVEELIEEFPDQLELDRVTQVGDATYFALASCPFKGAPHKGQDVGAGKTTIILRPDTIGFKCFSDDCSSQKFVDLLHLLHRETGRWPQTPIWEEDDLEVLAERWGCQIEDATPTVGQAEEEDYVELDNNQINQLTALFVKYIKLEDETIKQHRPALHQKFRALAETIMRTKNLDAMLEYLGGLDAFHALASIPDDPTTILTIDQLDALLFPGRLLPEHREGEAVVDLLAA